MTGKEALKNFIKTLCEYETDTNNKESVYPCWYRIILEDLERLEKVEKENQKLKNTILSLELDTCIPELRKENTKLKQALDKACERLEYYIDNCPCGEELIEDLDCDECDSNCKECWKKYFMKEVLENA